MDRDGAEMAPIVATVHTHYNCNQSPATKVIRQLKIWDQIYHSTHVELDILPIP